MLVTSVTAKLTDQNTPDYVLHLSLAQLGVIINGMINCPVYKIDVQKWHMEIVEALRKLHNIRSIDER